MSLRRYTRVIFIAIDSEFILTQIRNKYGNIHREWVLRSKEPTLMHLDRPNASNFEGLCYCIKFIIQDSGPDYADGIIYGFTTIFANLLTTWRKRGVSVPAVVAGIVQGTSPAMVTGTVSGNVSETVSGSVSGTMSGNVSGSVSGTSQEAMSGEVAIPKAQKVLMRFQSDIHNFSRRFSTLVIQASGRKPSSLITEYIILEAKSLLQSGQYTVHQVCELLGFENDSFFNRYFKKSTGLTPGRWIRQFS